MDMNKPFKLVNANRHIKKGVVTKNLEDIIEKARLHFKIDLTERIQLVLEDDGTEIVEDEYLMLLEDNTQIMILRIDKGDEWAPKPFTIDVTDHSQSHQKTEATVLDPVSTFKDLAKNPSLILLLNPKELEILTQFDTSKITGVPGSVIEFLVEKCEEELEQKRKINDAVSLVHLYKKAKDQSHENP